MALEPFFFLIRHVKFIRIAPFFLLFHFDQKVKKKSSPYVSFPRHLLKSHLFLYRQMFPTVRFLLSHVYYIKVHGVWKVRSVKGGSNDFLIYLCWRNFSQSKFFREKFEFSSCLIWHLPGFFSHRFFFQT